MSVVAQGTVAESNPARNRSNPSRLASQRPRGRVAGRQRVPRLVLAALRQRTAGGISPGAWSTVPLVVGGADPGARRRARVHAQPRASWLSRVIAGVVLGTAASTVLVRAALGFEGVSRMAFVADALLFSIAAVGWRGAWVLEQGARARLSRGRGATTWSIARTR